MRDQVIGFLMAVNVFLCLLLCLSISLNRICYDLHRVNKPDGKDTWFTRFAHRIGLDG